MPVDLQVADDLEVEDPLQRFEQALEVVVTLTGDERTRGDLCVRICDAAESAELNTTYRGQHKPTNVLSFPADVQVRDVPPLLGDLAICLPVVTAEAQAQGKLFEHHLQHLFVHGVLHLLGFDHIDDAQAKEMEDLETRILQQLGISDPYAL